MSVRNLFASTLASTSSASVFAEEPATPPGLPALVIRPGSPYRQRGVVPHCMELWRLEVLALVPIDTARPLDALDPLIDSIRAAIDATPTASYRGVTAAPVQLSIGGKAMRAAIVELELST
jgi:hypothetical protein